MHDKPIELGLERVGRVYRALGSPRPPRVVIIAGTNGKGTAAHALDHLARALGWRTARYTSPHLRHFAERVCFDGQPASAADLCTAFARVEQARGDLSLSYFEYTTLAALWLFARAAPQLCILEVGLGGRLDATNIVDADAALFGSIALDHTDWLGEDLNQIAAEKAAVARAGRPALISDPDSEAYLGPHLRRIGARTLCAGRDWQLQADGEGSRMTIAGTTLNWEAAPGLNRWSLAGAIRLLAEWVPLPELQAVVPQLANLRIPGRCERQPRDYGERVLDVAHNPRAAQWLAEHLGSLPRRPQWLVLGLQQDKDIGAIAAVLAPLVQRVFLCTLPPPRGAPAATLAPHFAGLACSLHAEPAAAIAAAESAATQSDEPIRIIICGSFVTVGAACSG